MLAGNFALDLLFPKNCLGCGLEGVWLCAICQQKIVIIRKSFCPKCQKLTDHFKFCTNCRKHSNLTRLYIAAYYQEGPLKEAIHSFKYEGVFDIGKDLAKILVYSIKEEKQLSKSVIIPVPLYRKRQAQRGYNQAEILAKHVSQKFTIKLIKNKLLRIKATKKTQVELSGRERRANVKGIFNWHGGNNEIKNKIVILVDDVYTTGATLEECAKVLRRNGVRQIWGLVLAKS